MKRTCRVLVLALAAGVLLSVGAHGQSTGPEPAPSHETTSVTVRTSGRTQVLTLAALRQLPRVTLADVQQLGSHGGPRTWVGASLRDVLQRRQRRNSPEGEESGRLDGLHQVG
jgi:hypothetical protein